MANSLTGPRQRRNLDPPTAPRGRPDAHLWLRTTPLSPCMNDFAGASGTVAVQVPDPSDGRT